MKKLLALLVLGSFVSTSIQAVTLAPGTMETRVAGQLDSTTSDGTLVDLNISYGYFFLDNLQAGGRLTFLDNDDKTAYGISAFSEYNFEIGSDDWMPFVELSLGLVYGDGEGGVDELAVTAEGQVGIKYFLAPNVALSLAAVLDVASDEIYQDDDKFDDVDAKIQLAIRYYY